MEAAIEMIQVKFIARSSGLPGGVAGLRCTIVHGEFQSMKGWYNEENETIFKNDSYRHSGTCGNRLGRFCGSGVYTT
jgi:hypothetical protein